MADGLRQRNIQKGNPRKGRMRRKEYGFSGGVKASGYGLAFSANAKANYALSQLNTEKKFKDVSTAPTSATSSITLLNGLVRGTTSGERIGQTVRFTSLAMRVAFANTNAETIWLRYMLVRDMAPNGSTPAVTDILREDSVQSYRNLDYTNRFKILEDKVLTLPEASSSIGYPGSGFNNIYIDLEGRAKNKSKEKDANETNYGLGNAGTIADIAKGAYYLVLVSSAVTNNVTFSFDSRMRYIDN